MLWNRLGIEITATREAVGKVEYMCASEVSVGPVDDQPFEVMDVGREG